MVKIKNPLLSFIAHGKLGDITFRHSRKTSIAEETPVVPDQKTPAQLAWRHMYQKCAALWHTLSVAEKADWEGLGSARHMTGFSYWQSQCLRPNPGIYLPLQGGTMSGDIDMAKHRLLKLPLPTHSQEAARKAEVDAVTGEHSLMYWRLLDRWHFSFPQQSSTYIVLYANRLHAVPFYAAGALTIEKIGLYVTTGSAGDAHLGIYNDNGSLYPGSLLSDCGTIDVTALGNKEISGLEIPLAANTLYWLAYIGDSTPAVRHMGSTASYCLLGTTTPDPATLCGWYYVGLAYAPLPDPFTPGADEWYANIPGIGVYLT